VKISDKIVNWEKFTLQVRRWQGAGLDVVFTNGCFDILHRGHVAYLEEAKALGDKLVIGLNSDASTKKLKWDSRPVNDQESRAFVLAALGCVDLVTVFDQDTPLELITEVRPDILAKGGDYIADDIVGGDVVRSLGGQVIILPFHKGFSTTAIEQKMHRQSK
jgi:rfaE bifunctional protein nucleotidyltransferase chain/domain